MNLKIRNLLPVRRILHDGLSPEDEFHAHLDVCNQCQDHPFSLCGVGAKLIREAVGSSN